MKLYQQLTEKKPITSKEILDILRALGIEEEFHWFAVHPHFVNFVYYFVHCYSVESTMMDTSCYSESLELIENHYDLDLEEFKADCGDDFDSKYFALINFYLKIQRNRDYKTLITGNILYEQMSAATFSTSLKKKAKEGEEPGVDFKVSYENFLNCKELNEVLKKLEQTSQKLIDIVEAVENNTDEKVKSEIRMETHLPERRT